MARQEVLEAFFPTNPRVWALGYLNGRAEAFRRGRLTGNYVRGAVRKALALGVSRTEVANLLAGYELTWDAERELLIPL